MTNGVNLIFGSAAASVLEKEIQMIFKRRFLNFLNADASNVWGMMEIKTGNYHFLGKEVSLSALDKPLHLLTFCRWRGALVLPTPGKRREAVTPRTCAEIPKPKFFCCLN